MIDENGNKVTLQYHLEQIIKERTDRLDERIKSLEKATVVAKEQMDKRLDGMNEFRDTLKDQAGRFITRDEMNIKMDALEKTRKDNTSLLISLAGLTIAIISLLIKVI